MKTQNLRTFYTIILTQTLSMIGSRVSGLALGIWLFTETGNATPLALVAFFGLVPQIIMQGFAGVLADRWDRRYVMAISDAGQAGATLILLVLFLSGQFVIWHLYLVIFIQALFGVFQGPAFTASVTMLIPDDQRDRANAIMQMTGPAAGIIAPIIAGLIFAAIGVVGAITIDLITFGVAVLVIMLVKIPRPRKTEEGAKLSGSMLKEMTSGLVFLWERKGLFWMLMAAMALNFVLNMSGVLMTPYLLERTGSEAAYGFILGVFNAGALVGGIVISVWGGTRPRIYTIIGGVVAMGIAVILVGMAQTTILLAITCFFVLLPNMFANVSLQSILQAKVAPDVQGRVFGAIGQLAMLMSPIAYLIAGPLADKVMAPLVSQPQWDTVAPLVGSNGGAGIGLLFVISGIATILLALAMLFVPSIRNVEADLPDYIPEPAPDEIEPELVPA